MIDDNNDKYDDDNDDDDPITTNFVISEFPRITLSPCVNMRGNAFL